MSHDIHHGPAGHGGEPDGQGSAMTPRTGSGAVEERFPDPGLPAHRHRLADTDPRAAKRAERQVATLFALSALGSILFVVGYFAFPLDSGQDENVLWNRTVTGLGLGLAMFCIGAGAVQWAKKLMPDVEVVEERHPFVSTPEEQQAAVGVLRQGGEETGFGRRKLIWGSMVGAFGALLLPAVVPLRDLWHRRTDVRPDEYLKYTMWDEGDRLAVDPTGRLIRPEELRLGQVVHVLPEALIGHGDLGDADRDTNLLAERNKAAVLLIRIEPEKLEPEFREGAYDGIIALSKICTHVGCPIALYEQKTHHLLCPCHQSTFDITQNARVIFGPAARPLPQLAISVDPEGYLVAQRDFTEPVGPSYWEGGTGE